MSAIVKSAPSAALAVSGNVRLDGVGDVFKLAQALAQADGFVPKHLVGKPNAIAAAVLTGLELGMGPMEAMRSIHVVDGKPTMAAEVMLARAIRAGVRVEWEQTDANAAVVKLERSGMKHRHSFTIEEARAAGVTAKDNWKKYPAAMLRARCVSAAMRAFCPDVLGAGVYTPEELERTEPARAEVVANTPTPKRTLDDIAAPTDAAADLIRRIEALDSRHDLDALRESLNADPPRLSRGERAAVRAALEMAQARIDAAEVVTHEEAAQ